MVKKFGEKTEITISRFHCILEPIHFNRPLHMVNVSFDVSPNDNCQMLKSPSLLPQIYALRYLDWYKY